MPSKYISLEKVLYGYLLANSLRKSPCLEQLRAKTASLPIAVIQLVLAHDNG